MKPFAFAPILVAVCCLFAGCSKKEAVKQDPLLIVREYNEKRSEAESALPKLVVYSDGLTICRVQFEDNSVKYYKTVLSDLELNSIAGLASTYIAEPGSSETQFEKGTDTARVSTIELHGEKSHTSLEIREVDLFSIKRNTANAYVVPEAYKACPASLLGLMCKLSDVSTACNEVWHADSKDERGQPRFPAHERVVKNLPKSK